MARIAVATLQTLWDCRWSRPPANGRTAPCTPRAQWVCIRAGRRPVTEEECEHCEHWEAGDIEERDERG